MPEEERHDEDKLSSPYGPQYRDVDEAAGGADSSPFETTSSEEREEHRRSDRGHDPAEKGPRR